MASGYAQLTGKTGICFVTRAPGATNASIGVHTAFQGSIPSFFHAVPPTIKIGFLAILNFCLISSISKLDIEGSGNLILKEGFISQGIDIMSSGRDTITGPGLPVLAILNALETISGILLTLFISVTHFAIPEYISL